jgi:hypothetical protein
MIKDQPLNIGLALIIAFLLVLAIARMYNGIQGAFQDNGSFDFLNYWSNGQSVRWGSHWAYSLGGNNQVALTPSLILITSLFSYLSWDLAKLIWTPINVVLILMIPWLVLYLITAKPVFPLQVLMVLLFYGMSGLSIGVRAGQPTILVFFFLVLTLVLVRQDKKSSRVLCSVLRFQKLPLAYP